jgi:DNA modification methylase
MFDKQNIQITQIPIADLKVSDYNPRKWNDNQKQELKDAITKFGVVSPLIVNSYEGRKGIIIGGSFRYEVLKELGYVEVPCVYINIPNLENEKNLCLRLNKAGGSWDENLLREMDLDLLLEVGFGDDELQSMFDDVDVIEDDFDFKEAIKETKISKVKSGEIWQLGKHRLLVGDSTDESLVKKLMQDERADVIYCDPPYNIGLDYSKGVGGASKYDGTYSGKDDSKKDVDYGYFIENSITTALSVSRPDAHFFYWCDSKYIWLLQTLYKKLGIESKRVCMWIKNNSNPTPQIAFNKVYEPCVYGIKGKPHLNKEFNNANEILNQEVTSGNQLQEEILEMMDLWIVKRDNTKEYLHPTQKPVALNEKPFKRCSSPGQIIFSGFAGSGSDLIACEELNRKWRGVEQDLIFATIVIDRWEKFTNQKAILLYANN